eukprot:2232993-Ditylum_brightwellii.AAC.1
MILFCVLAHDQCMRRCNITNIIQWLKWRFKLTFLQYSMAYRYYTNLHEKFRGYLVSKVNADVKSLDFKNCPCNYSRLGRVNGHCMYK